MSILNYFACCFVFVKNKSYASTIFSYLNPQPITKLQSNPNSSAEEIYAALYEGMPDDCKRCAEQKLKETQENKEKGIKKLREFAKKENLKCNEEDTFVKILRFSKYNIRKAESNLKHFLKVRRETIQNLKYMEMEKIETIIDDIIVGVLPYRDKHRRVIVCTRPNLHLDLYSIDDVVFCLVAFLMFLLSFPMTTVYGITYIGDCKCPSQFYLFCVLKSVIHYIPSHLVNFPVLYKRADLVNELFFIRCLMRLVNPLLPRKLKERISFHGSDFSNLHKHFSPDLLPTEFGGTLGPINNTFYREKLLLFIRNLIKEDE